MAVYHEVKEITQLEDTLLTFQLNPYTDDLFRTQPLTLGPIAMTSGSSPFDPTFRLTVKAKEDDADEYALFQKTIPPYPDNLARWGVVIGAGTIYRLTGGILYINNEPWWFWYRTTWPPGYNYSPTTPPTNWDPANGYGGGLAYFLNAFDPFVGEVSFQLKRYDSWFPPGDYFGWLEVWRTGAGTIPSGVAPALVLQCTIRINKTSRRNPIF